MKFLNLCKRETGGKVDEKSAREGKRKIPLFNWYSFCGMKPDSTSFHPFSSSSNALGPSLLPPAADLRMILPSRGPHSGDDDGTPGVCYIDDI